MKKLAIVLLLIAGLASPALADPIGETGTLYQTRVAGYYSGQGGEFTVYSYTGIIDNDAYAAAVKNIGSPDPTFQTFCLELNEYADTNPMHYTVNSSAVAGGVGGPKPDPISVGTAWLYKQFVSGTLTGYFSGTRSVQAGLLQNAIWMLEDELLTTDPRYDLTNPYWLLAGAAAGKADADQGYLDIYVLNNWVYGTDQRIVKKQDFLWADYVPTPDGGATLMLLGGALFGLGALRRKVGR